MKQPAVLLILCLASSPACSRSGSGAHEHPATADARSNAAPEPPVQMSGRIEIGMPGETQDAGEQVTTLVVGTALASFSGTNIAIALINDQAQGIDCSVFARMGSTEGGNGWGLRFSNPDNPYNGQPGIVTGMLMINHPVEGRGVTNMLEGPVTITRITRGVVEGQLQLANSRGDRYARGPFVARRCNP